MRSISRKDIRKVAAQLSYLSQKPHSAQRYVTIFICILFASCELVVDIDVPFEQEQLVLNSFFHPDSVWRATLGANQHILDTLDVKRIENALIVIYDDNVLIDTLIHLADGVYRSDTGKPIAGHTYEVRVSASGYEEITARSHVPVPTVIRTVEISDGVSEDGYPEKVFTIRFDDDPFTPNFYAIYLDHEYEYLSPEGKIVASRQHLPIGSNDLTVQDRDFYSYGLLIKDTFFQNGTGVVSLTSSVSNLDVLHYMVTVRTLSEDHYSYASTGSLQEETSGNPFAQPVNVYNNIENGFGIFAGFSTSQHIMGEPKPRPVIHSITPLSGAPGDTVHISGENFDNPSYDFANVIFNAEMQFVYAYPISSTSNEIEVIIPRYAITGKIYVSNGSKITASDVEFEVTQ